MAGVLLPISVVVGYYDNNMQKLAGGTINSYTAGTTTPINTYTDSTLGTSNGTSLTLDANGRPTQEMWVAAGTTVKIIVKDSSGNQIGPTLDNLSGLNDLGSTQNLGPFWGGSSSGTANALTLTFSSGPSSYQAGQRITFLATATNTTASTVNVNGLGLKAIQNNTAALVGGEIINGNLYELEYTGAAFQLSAKVGDPVTIKGVQTITGQKTMSGAAFVFANEVLNVASAATVNLDAVASNYAQISGTTTITAITLANGSRKDVVFSGALTLTNGASLILPSGRNITTAAGDTATFIGEASSVVRCVAYNKTSGYPVVDPLVAISGNNFIFANDTTEDTAATVTVPANLMGANGCLRVTTWWLASAGGSSTKTARIRFGGTQVATFTLGTGLALYHSTCYIQNANSTSAQNAFEDVANTAGTVAIDNGTSAIDTTADVSLTITGQKVTGTDGLQLNSYSVEVLR